MFATELPCENPSSTEPLNKGKHDQDAENKSPHSWTHETPKTKQSSQRPGLTQHYWLQLFPWAPCCSFCCSPAWAAHIWHPTRLLALIKKLHIPPGCRGKLRKVCSIRTENKGSQTKGGWCSGIGQSILAQILPKHAAWNKDLLQNISKLTVKTGLSYGSVKRWPGLRMYNTTQTPACPETGTHEGHGSLNVQTPLSPNSILFLISILQYVLPKRLWGFI